MGDPGTLSGEIHGKLGLEASKNSIFKKLTSKIGPKEAFYEKAKNFKLPQKLIGNNYKAKILRKCLCH